MPLARSMCWASAIPMPACSMSSPSSCERQILYAVRTIIERRLALSPLLIVVEDLHWADAVSLEALRFVMDRLERTRLMLVVTHRPALDNDPLELKPGQPHGAPAFAAQTPATDKGCSAALFGDRWSRSSGKLRDRILERAGGNPLFVEEIVRGLIESRRADARGLSNGGSRPTTRRPTFRPTSRQCCSLASTGCRRRCAGWPRRPRSSARASMPRLLKAVAADPARLEAGLELLCDAEIIEEVAGLGLDVVAKLPLYADDAAGRDLPEPSAAAAHRNARADRRRARAHVRRRARTARGSDRCSAIISA